MSITILSRISMCPGDLALLDKMAAAAGKSRDVFVSDWMGEMIAIERLILGPDEGDKNGAHTNRQA